MQKISVIIPTYNSEKTIIRTLESVFTQEGLNEDFTFEVLICDDGSEDKTIEICGSYPVRILKNEKHTGGPNAGRNNGIRNATGDIITFLDHDDEWLPAKTRVQLSKILCGYEFVYSTYLPDSNVDSCYMGSVMMINRNVPFFEEQNGKFDYDWQVEATGSRKCAMAEPLVVRHLTGVNLSFDPIYRKDEFEIKRGMMSGDTLKGLYQSRARYLYKHGRYSEARELFLKSKFTPKNAGYYITSFIPPVARLVVKLFKVSGF